MLLALDTATPAVTVAVADGARVLAERTQVDPRRHGELLAPAIEFVLRDAGLQRRDLTAVAVGTGPGPFTGLRVGLVTARTLGHALGIPVVGVCTLDHLALAFAELSVLSELSELSDPRAGIPAPGSDNSTGEPLTFRVVTDARRREVHWGTYVLEGDRPRRLDGPHVDPPAAVAWEGPAVGAGAVMYAEHFPGHRGPELPSAAALARWVALGLPTGAPDPLYLRRPDAAEPGPRKRVS